MTYAIYCILIVCLLLPIINQKYLAISVLLMALFFYYLHVNCSNTILCKNGNIYLNTNMKLETFQNYIPNNISPYSAAQERSSWNSYCSSNPDNCTLYDNTKPGFIEAGKSLGISNKVIFYKIQIPIAIKQSLPAYGNEINPC